MISIYQFKPAFQSQLRPLVASLAQMGIKANQITIAALILSLFMGEAIAVMPQSRRLWLLLPIVLLIRMALNAIDGILAREHHQKTPLGAILNELGDVVSDAVLYLPFCLIPGVNATLITLVVVLSLIAEMTGVLGGIHGVPRQYDGPMGKSDRAVVFGTVALLLAGGLTPGLWLNVIWTVVVGLSIWTIVNRGRSILREIAKNGTTTTTQ